MKSTNCECQSCGNIVSHRFAAVFGNEDGEIHGCMDCMELSIIRNGGAAVEDETSISY